MTVSRSGRPLVSVIIPTYNSGPYIRDCLDSVYRQTGPFTLDVVVVDDGSTDDTVAQVSHGYALRYIEQSNRGPAAARNAALDEARGDFVAFLDSDDLWPEGKLARQLAVLESHPDVGLVFGDCRQFDESGEYKQTLFAQGGWDDAFWGDPVYVTRPYAKLLLGSFITTGSVVMRRACVEAVGRFNEALRLVEDLEYWLRVALEFPIAHVADVCLLRRRHGDNTSRDQIAMCLAALRILDVHQRNHGAAARSQGADLTGRFVREYQELGHLYMRRGTRTDAARAYARAFLKRPRLRSLYYLLSTLTPTRGAPGPAKQ